MSTKARNYTYTHVRQLKTLSFYLLLGSSILYLSCASDEEVFLDEQLRPYVLSFVQEGRLRGIELDAGSIEGILTEVESSGQCVHNTDGPSRLQIDKMYWASASALSREFLVYHELGHCLLDRRHLDTTDQRGNCISIMHSSSLACTNTYGPDTRTELLDELFDQSKFGR